MRNTYEYLFYKLYRWRVLVNGPLYAVRHLERLEAERMNRRHAARRGDRIRIALPSGLVTAAERLTEIESDIAELRARLGVLLADSDEEPEVRA
jgi:hypothetical protein